MVEMVNLRRRFAPFGECDGNAPSECVEFVLCRFVHGVGFLGWNEGTGRIGSQERAGSQLGDMPRCRRASIPADTLSG